MANTLQAVAAYFVVHFVRPQFIVAPSAIPSNRCHYELWPHKMNNKINSNLSTPLFLRGVDKCVTVNPVFLHFLDSYTFFPSEYYYTSMQYSVVMITEWVF